MKVKIAFLLLGTSLLSGCLHVAHLYPVQGPLAAQTPPPVYAVKVTGAFNSGGISATLADGEVFKGPWKALSVEDRAHPGNGQQSFSLASAWDTVYGPNFYTSHVHKTVRAGQSDRKPRHRSSTRDVSAGACGGGRPTRRDSA